MSRISNWPPCTGCSSIVLQFPVWFRFHRTTQARSAGIFRRFQENWTYIRSCSRRTKIYSDLPAKTQACRRWSDHIEKRRTTIVSVQESSCTRSRRCSERLAPPWCVPHCSRRADGGCKEAQHGGCAAVEGGGGGNLGGWQNSQVSTSPSRPAAAVTTAEELGSDQGWPEDPGGGGERLPSPRLRPGVLQSRSELLSTERRPAPAPSPSAL